MKKNDLLRNKNIKVVYNFADGQATTRDDLEEHILMTNMISKRNSTSFDSLVVYSSARTNSTQTPLNVKSITLSVITIVSIVLGGIGAILLIVHLILTIKPVFSQSKTI